MKKIEIITASVTELIPLSNLYQQYRVFYKQSPDEIIEQKFIKERLGNNESVIFLAKVDGEYAGFTQLFPIFSSVKMKRMWLLNDLYVNQNFRKLGIANLLIERSKELARETGAGGLMLQTAIDNTQAQSVYDKTGFERDDDFYTYYWRNTQ